MENELASPPREWDEPRVPRERVLFGIEFPTDNPTEAGYETISY